MSAEKPPSAGNTEYKRWAERLNSYLVRTRSQLAYYVAGQTASEDGVLLWDADNSRLLVSSAGSWIPVVGGGGGGGTITNYLRDDADDSTDFRLTMGGLTVDTDTLYVNSSSSAVGIGTTLPSEKLEVVGNVEATEFIGDLRGAVVFKAQAGEALTKGDVVYISGISGNTTVVSKADADDAAKMPAFGLAAKDANNSANLEVYTFGTLSGLDTSSYTEGDELFVGTTAGALVTTAPAGEGSRVQKVGKVTRSHASSGSIKIMGAGRTNATPNLNDGNIFIGDSNNRAATASLATQVSSLETSHNDVVVDGDFTSEGLMKRGATSGSYSIVTDNSSDWDAAHDWGNHADAGYLTTAVLSDKADTAGDTFTGDITIQGNSNDLIFDQNSAGAGTQQILWENKTDGTRSAFIKGIYTYETGVGRSQTRLSFGTTPTDASGDGVVRLDIFAGGHINFYNEAGSTVGLRWDATNQRLGLGTTSPSQTLDVVGNIAVSGTVDGVDISTLNSNAIVDGDFTAAGIMTTDGNGVYSVDTNTYLTTHQDISGKADLSGATFTGNVAVGIPPSGTEALTVAGVTNLYGGADLQNTDITDVDTLTAKNVDISTTGTVTTNIATGAAASGASSTKTVNIGTGFAGFFGGLTTINIGTQSTSNQNTVNIGSGVSTLNKEDTINLKGNVTVDGTLSGLSHNYVIPLFQGYTNLGTSPAQIGDDFYLRNYNNKHYKRFVEVNAAMGYSGTSSTNDLNLRVIMVVPTSSGNAVDIGSVVSITSTSIYNRDIVVAGDVTHWFSDYAGVGANSNGATPFTSVVSAVYNPTTDQTTFNVGVYGATIPSTGDSIYVHPFDWEGAGSELYGHTKQFDVDAEASMNYTIYTKIYFGNIDRIATCRLKFYETASSDSVNIQRLQVYQIDESV